MTDKEFELTVVKNLIKRGEIFAAEVACEDWNLDFDKIYKEVKKND